MKLNKEKLIQELQFKAIRSSGPGGQHVNKVSSKIALSFDVAASQHVSARQKEIIQEKLANRINKEGVLLLFCEQSRSQHKNKELAVKRFLALLAEALKPKKIRRATKPSRASLIKKAVRKKNLSQKKQLRKKPTLE